MDLKENDLLGLDINGHWYYASKAKAMREFLPSDLAGIVLDVGAGSGFFSHHLLQTSGIQEAWCVDISYPEEGDELIPSGFDSSSKSVHYRKSTKAIPAKLVLLMDVLEHVEDDVGLLRHYIGQVPSGSQFLVTAPAFQFLWSAHDDFLEHKRRYTLRHIEQVARQSGLEITSSAYYFGLVFPLAAILRILEKFTGGVGAPRSQLKKHHFIVNAILKGLCKLELSIMKWNRFAGLSVFCLARKP